MKVKEAIEVCKCILNWPNSTIRTTEENIGGLREVISLLQQGEAYETILNELKNDTQRSKLFRKHITYYEALVVIEQKYLKGEPK